MLKNLTKLILILSLSNFVYADTTGNLVSQDFTSGWTNTGNTYHGSGTIAGHHNGTVESDSVSLNAEGINKESLNEGFTVTGGADIWFWNDATQSVTQTIKTVDDNGGVLTQNRTISGSCATLNDCSFSSYTDQLIVSSNTQQDYNVSLKFAFSESTNSTSHWAADLKNPSLTVSYTYVPPLDSATQTALFDLNEDIKEDLSILNLYDAEILTEEFKQDIGVNYVNDFTGEIYGTEPPTDLGEPGSLDTQTESFPEDTEEMTFQDTFTESSEPSDEKTDAPLSQAEDSQDPQEPQSVEQEQSSLQAEQKLNEEQDTETETSTEEEQKTEVATDSKDNVSGEKKSVSLEKSMEKIDTQVKDIGKNLQLKNLVKLKIMNNNDVLQQYANIQFYKPKDIYKDQADIRDNRILYANSTLISYTQNDPIFTKEQELFNIKVQKEKLLEEIEVLKNGL